MFVGITNFLKTFVPISNARCAEITDVAHEQPPLRALGINDFLNLDIPPRGMLLDPILPERSLSMLYAPRGVGQVRRVLEIFAEVVSFESWGLRPIWVSYS